MLTDADRSFKQGQDDGVAIFDFETPGYIVRDAS
jgi:hypothetical protein